MVWLSWLSWFARGTGCGSGSDICWEGLNQESLGDECGRDWKKEGLSERKPLFTTVGFSKYDQKVLMKDIDNLSLNITHQPTQGICMENVMAEISGFYPNCDFSCCVLTVYSTPLPSWLGSESRYTSDFLWQNTWPKRLQGKEAYFLLIVLQDTAYHGREGLGEGLAHGDGKWSRSFSPDIANLEPESLGFRYNLGFFL